MTALTVWRFATPYGADEAELRVKMLRDRGAVVVHDAATVVWMPDAKKPKVRTLKHMRGSKALGGAFWGTLVGTVVGTPVAGAAIGAAAGATTSHLKASGIDDAFIAQLRDRLTPGTSAIFLLTSDADLEQVRLTFPLKDAELIHADLEPGDEDRMRELLGDDSD